MEPTRVNIQYSIDLSELPTEVERMLFKVTDCIDGAAQEGQTLENQDDLLTIGTLNKISDLRLCLSRADLILEDMVKIIGGYVKMNMDNTAQQTAPVQQEQQPVPQPEPPQATPRPPSAMERPFKPQAPDFRQLQEKLQKFADSLPDENSTEATSD